MTFVFGVACAPPADARLCTHDHPAGPRGRSAGGGDSARAGAGMGWRGGAVGGAGALVARAAATPRPPAGRLERPRIEPLEAPVAKHPRRPCAALAGGEDEAAD